MAGPSNQPDESKDQELYYSSSDLEEEPDEDPQLAAAPEEEVPLSECAVISDCNNLVLLFHDDDGAWRLIPCTQTHEQAMMLECTPVDVEFPDWALPEGGVSRAEWMAPLPTNNLFFVNHDVDEVPDAEAPFQWFDIDEASGFGGPSDANLAALPAWIAACRGLNTPEPDQELQEA